MWLPGWQLPSSVGSNWGSNWVSLVSGAGVSPHGRAQLPSFGVRPLRDPRVWAQNIPHPTNPEPRGVCPQIPTVGQDLHPPTETG